MKKLLVALMSVLFTVVFVFTTVDASGTFSTTLWGNGTIDVRKSGTNHLTVENKSTETIKKVQFEIRPISLSHTKPTKIVVRINKRIVCQYEGRRLLKTNICRVGNLPKGSKVDIALSFRGVSTGLDEWLIYFNHDGWRTDYNFALTVK